MIIYIMKAQIRISNRQIEEIRQKNGFIIDMDGVLYHGNLLLPGVQKFVSWLVTAKKRFVFLTNSSERTPKELKDKLSRLGVEVDKNVFYTSALATAMFLNSQRPKGSVYIIGEAGLINALYNIGYTMNNIDPDYVKEFMREVPTCWDDTCFIDGFPGKLAIIARRFKDTWYVAGINGENIGKSLSFELPFLESTGTGIFITDGADNRSFAMREINVAPGKVFKTRVKGNGGFVIKLED